MFNGMKMLITSQVNLVPTGYYWLGFCKSLMSLCLSQLYSAHHGPKSALLDILRDPTNVLYLRATLMYAQRQKNRIS